MLCHDVAGRRDPWLLSVQTTVPERAFHGELPVLNESSVVNWTSGQRQGEVKYTQSEEKNKAIQTLVFWVRGRAVHFLSSMNRVSCVSVVMVIALLWTNLSDGQLTLDHKKVTLAPEMHLNLSLNFLGFNMQHFM
ncbi:thrombospondin type-1 domain-containing protein 4 [Tachysurus ichikawai]